MSFSGARCQASPRASHQALNKNLSFFEFFFKMSPNFAVEGQPTGIPVANGGPSKKLSGEGLSGGV